MDARDDVGGALGRAADRGGDLVRGHRLLIDGGDDATLHLGDAPDDVRDLADRVDGALRVALNRLDPFADLAGCRCRLLGELLHLVGDDSKPLAGLPGAGRLDGGVESQEVGLCGDRGDHIDDLADLRAGFTQLGNRAIGLVRHRDGLVGDDGRFLRTVGDLGDGARQRCRCHGDAVHACGDARRNR